MKNKKSLFLLIAIVAFIFTSCDKDKKDEAKELTLDKTEVTLKAGDFGEVKITDGNGSYSAKSADDQIATASVKDDIVTITAVKEGNTTITITDAKKKTAEIKVTIEKKEEQGDEEGQGDDPNATPTPPAETLSLEKSSIDIVNGEEETNNILKTNNKYSVTIEPTEVAFCRITDQMKGTEKIGSAVSMKALKVGTAKVIVKDEITKEIGSFIVNVTPAELRLSKSSIEFYVQDKLDVVIATGNPNYTVISSPENIVETTLQERTGGGIFVFKEYFIHVKAIKAGTTTIKVTDSQNKVAEISVRINDSKVDVEADGSVKLKPGVRLEGKLIIPETATKIGDNLFKEQKEITEVDLKNVTEIGTGAFQSSYVTSVKMNNVTKIGQDAFQNSKIQTAEMNNVTELGDRAFSTTPLTSAIMPKVKKIGKMAFLNCKSMVTLEIGDVETIQMGTFSNCADLESVTMGNVKTIDNMAFANCKKLKTIKVKNQEPPTITAKTFMGVTGATIYVPQGSKTKYEADENWKKLGTFHEQTEEMQK